MVANIHSQLTLNKPIGEYLIEAGLLSTAQVEVILADQQFTELKFGEIAVLRGWIKQQTVEYLMIKIIYPERHYQPQPAQPPIPTQTIPLAPSRSVYPQPILLPGQRLSGQASISANLANSSGHTHPSVASSSSGRRGQPAPDQETLIQASVPSQPPDAQVEWIG